SGIAVDPTDAKVVYVAGDAFGLRKSTNSGASWTDLPWDVAASRGQPIRVAIDPSDTKILYAMSAGRVARSVTGGQSWETLRSADEQQWAPTDLIVDPQDPATILLGTSFVGGQRLTIAPDLEITGTAPTSPAASGAPLAFAFTAANLGPFIATNAQVSL